MKPRQRRAITPVAMDQEDKLRVALSRFISSGKTVPDYEALLIAGATAYRQGIGLTYEQAHRIVVEAVVSSIPTPGPDAQDCAQRFLDGLDSKYRPPGLELWANTPANVHDLGTLFETFARKRAQ